MEITKLSLKNFRLFKEANFSFSSGVNLIHGHNARGKTTILEAMHLLSLGRSFRTHRFSDLHREGRLEMHVEADFVSRQVPQKLALHSVDDERRIFHNSTLYPTFSSLIGLLPLVVLSTDDTLVKGPPLARRTFLDMQIALTDTSYLSLLQRYGRALKQRNTLLRNGEKNGLAPWEQEMAKAAAQIIAKRKEVIAEQEKFIYPLFETLTKGVCTLQIHYAPKTTTVEALLEQYKLHQERELEMGYTLTGPHRDEIGFILGGRDARSFASEGQKRLLLATLALASWRWMQMKRNETPLMLLDDFGISLDEERRSYLLDQLSTLGQVFITSTEPALFQGVRPLNSIEIL